MEQILPQVRSNMQPQWYGYRIVGHRPEAEVSRGNEFRSLVPDLEDHPELWKQECPYGISDKSMSYVRVIKQSE